MQFSSIVLALGFAIGAVQAQCVSGTYACGNQAGAPGPDASVQICDHGVWRLNSQCGGGGNCCQMYTNAHVVCIC